MADKRGSAARVGLSGELAEVCGELARWSAGHSGDQTGTESFETDQVTLNPMILLARFK